MDETIDNLIEVHDPQVDIGSLVAHVQSNLEQRQKQADERGLDFTAISQGLPSLPADRVLSAATYYNLLKAEISESADAPELARALERLNQVVDMRRRMGEAGRSYIKRECDVSVIATQHTAFLTAVRDRTLSADS